MKLENRWKKKDLDIIERSEKEIKNLITSSTRRAPLITSASTVIRVRRASARHYVF
jgi:hypothetical protein